ncbi:transposase IS4 protein [Streptomyces lincolnensis]|uniref:Transposase IS4 protein n=1 Tax=Streptomyces lincolnensis TaxID=1915 RepID=A0A1B1MPU4_STRLN|nr:transposase IS4 protein [Streptomyces lincolnensis]
MLQKVRVRPPVGRPRTRPTGHNADLYKERNINRLKDWRGIATRFDKKPEGYFACLHLRASMIWINDLLKATG